jgi:hypothetical protein
MVGEEENLFLFFMNLLPGSHHFCFFSCFCNMSSTLIIFLIVVDLESGCEQLSAVEN